MKITVLGAGAMGMLIGNLPIDIPNMAVVQKVATEATIPLAIPMMLFCCRFTRSDASTQLKVVISGFLSVAIAVAVGYDNIYYFSSVFKKLRGRC